MSAREVVKALGGNWYRSYGMALCPAHDDGKEPGLKVKDTPDGGILVHCFAGCDWRDVKTALRRRGLLSEWRPGQDGDHVHRRRATTPPRRPDIDLYKRTKVALHLWHKAAPATGTPVETYLQGRGITITPPPTIRYLPDAKHGPTGLILPAMVAAVQDVDGDIVGIHRTFLKVDGSDKSPVSQNRMMLGPCAGGAVRLASVAAKLAVAEGIESALSVQQASGVPTWVAMSTTGVKALVLPPEVREVLLYPDGDEPGERAAVDAAKRFIREGRKVKITRPPRGKDANDLLRQGVGHG
jgi:hypothetical protein